MQNKGAIRLFAILLALVSLYQLSFTWITNSVRNDAQEYANGDKLKEAKYLDSISGKEVYNFLWLRQFTFKESQERELNLGLDLKGGMNVTLEVSVVELINALANNSQDSTFRKALQLAKQRQKQSQENFVDLFGQAFEEINPNGKLASIFMTLELKDRINFNSTNDEVIDLLKKETESAIENSFNVLRSRIDRFGVTQPNIQRLEGSGRIIIELPGIKEPERVRKLLQGTANLEFWETYDNTEVYNYLNLANTRLRDVLETEDETKKDTTGSLLSDVTVPDSTSTTLADSTAKDSTSILGNIADNTTTNTQPNTLEDFKKQNPLFGVLRPNVDQAGQLLQGAAVGVAHWNDTATVMQYLNLPVVKNSILPRDIKFAWEVKPIDEEENFYRLIAIRVSNRDGKAALGGEVITNARSEFGSNQATAEVNMTMNSDGAREWARITKENIGKQIAIVLDNYVYSYPVVNQEIRGGSSSISGNFTIAEANDLANVLKSGRLPAPARIIEEEIVGPSLGSEAINSGLISFIIAFVLVLLYMGFYYNLSGWVANVALITNVFFIFGVLASLTAVLTLPGIAGIVLTLGMAVDANVIIYERIREEMRAGKGLKLAIKDGYNAAYSAIIDGNVTTLLTGVILYIFGSGPIKGFATTLIIGILTSLFTAIFITRLIFIYFIDKEKNITFSNKLTANVLVGSKIDFIGLRKYAYMISGVVLLIGIVSLGFRGLKLGVDFKGGRTYVVRFEQPVSTVDVAASLGKTLTSNPEVKVYGENNQLKITTTYMIDSDLEDADNQVEAKIFEGLVDYLPAGTTLAQFNEQYKQSSTKVGPTIATDIKIQAFEAIIAAFIMMFLYIFIRFRKWQYGLGAIVALLHDALFVLGMYSILYSIMPFNLEIDQAFIAAILTVIGYSVNDTVIVFDRIREYEHLHKRGEQATLMNQALNSTLGRTLNTAGTTLVTLFAIFLFGGEVIRGFVFALLIGIMVGTYSSLFIATPFVYDTARRIEKAVDTIKSKRFVRKQGAVNEEANTSTTTSTVE